MGSTGDVFSLDASDTARYGTSSMRFKLWVDHFYNTLGDTFGGKEDDSFGQSVMERVHRYTITLGAGLSLFVVGLLIALLGGFPLFSLTKPGVYLVRSLRSLPSTPPTASAS